VDYKFKPTVNYNELAKSGCPVLSAVIGGRLYIF